MSSDQKYSVELLKQDSPAAATVTGRTVHTLSVVKTTEHYSGSRIRSSMWHYLVGRGMSGIGSFAVALLLIRVLPVDAYGAYTALAGLMVTLGIISDGGLDRIIPKFLPVLRTANVESRLARLCWQFLGLRTLFILVALIPVLLAPGWIASLLSIEAGATLIWPFALYTVLAVISVHLARTLQALLQQRDVARAMAIEWFSKLLLLVLLLAYLHTLPLLQVVWIQAGTVGVGALFLLIKLRRHLSHMADAGHQQTHVDIARERMWRFGWHNYLPNLIGILLCEGTIKLISAYYLGMAVTAALGFAYAITGVLRQYLPAVLMLGLIEPVFMARYAEHRDFTALNEFASIVLKINLFLLAPAAVWLCLAGHPLVDLVTAGKYTDTIWLVTGLMVALMLYSHFLVLQLIVNAIEESWLLLKCNMWASLVAMTQIGAMVVYGLPGLLVGILLLGWFKNVYLVRAIREKDYPYRPEWRGILRIVMLALLSGVPASLILRWQPGIPGSLLALVITALSFLLLAWAYKPFTDNERELLNRFIGREVFVW